MLIVGGDLDSLTPLADAPAFGPELGANVQHRHAAQHRPRDLRGRQLPGRGHALRAPRDPLVPARRVKSTCAGDDPGAAHAGLPADARGAPRRPTLVSGPDPGETVAPRRDRRRRGVRRRDRSAAIYSGGGTRGPGLRGGAFTGPRTRRFTLDRRPLRHRRDRRRRPARTAPRPASVDATLTVAGVTVDRALDAGDAARDRHDRRLRALAPRAVSSVGMDAFLAIVSRREVREYDGRPLPEDANRRILEAGRLAGSSQNRQQRRFVVLHRPRGGRRGRLHRPTTSSAPRSSSRSSSAGKGPLALDAGRAAQNMMLAAHNEGIGSCPNGVSDARRDRPRRRRRGGRAGRDGALVRLPGAARATRSAARAEEWIDRADRKPFDDVVSER